MVWCPSAAISVLVVSVAVCVMLVLLLPSLLGAVLFVRLFVS